ncbi:MAG TPA: hypothetical protein P5040_09270, partial [Smithella sp.]|nr:hypothetical protein [Smithella sp.]
IQFVAFYIRRFIRNLRERQRERNVLYSDWTARDVFTVPLKKAWWDIKRIWRNLFVRTYAGAIVNRWLKIYRESDYRNVLKQLSLNRKASR